MFFFFHSVFFIIIILVTLINQQINELSHNMKFVELHVIEPIRFVFPCLKRIMVLLDFIIRVNFRSDYAYLLDKTGI